MDAVYRPAISEALSDQGHIPGRLIFTVDDLDWKKGIARFTAGPRFSNGYGDARHLPTVLVENHSLKPYRQRVLGTYVLVAESLRLLGEKGAELREVVAEDRGRRPAERADGLPDGARRSPADDRVPGGRAADRGVDRLRRHPADLDRRAGDRHRPGRTSPPYPERPSPARPPTGSPRRGAT